MIKDTKKTSDPKEEWLQDLAEKVVHQQHLKKEMDILSSEIPKETNEIKFLRIRGEGARKRLNETQNAIKAAQLRTAGPRTELTRLQRERRLAAEEYERLKEKEKDIENRLSLLPTMQAEIKKLDEDIRKSSQRFSSLQTSCDGALQQRKRLEEESKSFQTKLLKLEEEIPVMRNTRDILKGKRPEHFDVDTFETIQDDVEMMVESYVSEVEGEIENINREMSLLNERAGANQREKETLLSKKGLLQERVEEFRTHIGEDKTKETLMTELDELEDHKNALAVEVEQYKQEVDRTEGAIKTVDDRLTEETQIDSFSSERRSYLISRKLEMDNFENVEEEILRIKDEIQRLNRESAVDKTLHKMIDRLNEETGPLRRQLRSSLEEQNRVFAEFEREINGLLSS